MCGICGIVGLNVDNLEHHRLIASMQESLAHRGPDGDGTRHHDHFIFGHRRLAIFDLEHGHQPMATADGQIVLTYNGEIYNHLDLRQNLIHNGYTFESYSDTEVLLRLYEAYGTECLRYLNGMFAFAIYDRRRNLFFAARDHFGIKPFYYCFLDDQVLVFASEIKALLSHPKIRPQIDNHSLQQYLTFQFCLGEKTLFKGIKKLEPGHFLVWNPREKEPQIKKYWDLDYSIDTGRSEEYFIDQLLLLLQDAVGRQLRSDVPVGAFLSGGLDSSTITCLAAGRAGEGFKCFTGKFAEGPAYDESRYAREVAAADGCEIWETIPTSRDFVELLPRLIYFMDEPAAGPGLFPQFMVCRLAREHVKVGLSGVGGDELFGGYARYLVAYLEQCIKGAIFETQDEDTHIITLGATIGSMPLLKEYVPMIKSFWREGLFEPMDRRYFRLVDRSHDLQSFLHPDLLKTYRKEEMFSQFQETFNHPQTQSYFNKMTHFDQKTLLPALLHVEDRVSMAVSLETRVPLLDYRIAELAARIPPKIKFKGGVLKYILKKAMENLLPRGVLKRQDKMGFPVPLSEWWQGPLRDFVHETLFSKTSRERGLFAHDQLEAVIRTDEHPFGRQLWGALCLELWCCAFLDRKTP